MGWRRSAASLAAGPRLPAAPSAPVPAPSSARCRRRRKAKPTRGIGGMLRGMLVRGGTHAAPPGETWNRKQPHLPPPVPPSTPQSPAVLAGGKEGALPGRLRGQTQGTQYREDKNSTESSSAPGLALRQRSAWFPMETSRRGPRSRRLPRTRTPSHPAPSEPRLRLPLGGDRSRIRPFAQLPLSRNSRPPHGRMRGPQCTFRGVPPLPRGQPGPSPSKMPPSEPGDAGGRRVQGRPRVLPSPREGGGIFSGCFINYLPTRRDAARAEGSGRQPGTRPPRRRQHRVGHSPGAATSTA